MQSKYLIENVQLQEMGLVICKYDNEQNKRLTDKKYKKQDEPWCISLQLSQACEAELNIL